jgi:hypothetical protein
MQTENQKALLQELINLHTQAQAVIEQLVGPKTPLRQTEVVKWYVHAEKGGTTTERYHTEKECNRLRKQPWDVLIDEANNMVVINSTTQELLYLAKMKRVMLWLVGEHYGRHLTEADIRSSSGTVAEDIYQYPRHLKAILGTLKDKVLGVKRGVSYPIHADWSLCWIRKHQIPETSDLLIGTPKHSLIQ